MKILGANWNLSSSNTQSEVSKKIVAKPKITYSVYFKDWNLKYQILFGNQPNRFNNYFQGVKQIQMS